MIFLIVGRAGLFSLGSVGSYFTHNAACWQRHSGVQVAVIWPEFISPYFWPFHDDGIDNDKDMNRNEETQEWEMHENG